MIKVDKEKCIGCGLCTSICPDVFALGKDGKAFAKAQKDLPSVKEAITSCPVEAISK
jgi:ferredoxin